MPVGYRQNGTDFDSLFDPDVRGDGPSVPSMRNGGTPLRYAAIAYGSKRANVGYRVNGSDVSNLWAARGTAQYVIPGLQGKALTANVTGLSGEPGAIDASVSVTIRENGQWDVAGETSRGAVSQPAPTSGSWLPPGATAGQFDVRFRVTATGDGTVSNGAPAYAQASTGPFTVRLLVAGPAQGNYTSSGGVSISIDLRRRATGQVTTTTLTGAVSVTGWT